MPTIRNRQHPTKRVIVVTVAAAAAVAAAAPCTTATAPTAGICARRSPPKVFPTGPVAVNPCRRKKRWRRRSSQQQPQQQLQMTTTNQRSKVVPSRSSTNQGGQVQMGVPSNSSNAPNTMSIRNHWILPTKCRPIPINCRPPRSPSNCRRSAWPAVFPRSVLGTISGK